MKTGKRAAALALALCLLLAGCGSKSGTSGPTRVVLIAKSTQTEFWKSVFAGAKAAASEYNVELTIAGPETEEDFAAQNDYIDRAVAGGAEALVFSAISYDENAPAIDRAAAAGVKVVVIDSDVHSNAVAARIGTDNVDAGRKAAEAALQVREGELVVGLINYDLGSRNGQEREAAARAGSRESTVSTSWRSRRTPGSRPWICCSGIRKSTPSSPSTSLPPWARPWPWTSWS